MLEHASKKIHKNLSIDFPQFRERGRERKVKRSFHYLPTHDLREISLVSNQYTSKGKIQGMKTW